MIDLYDNEIEHLPAISSEELSDEQVIVELEKIKQELVDQVVILGHHYQQDDIIRFADYTGDSLQLAKIAAKLEKKYILFCGVHFMAETADMLTGNDQHVILPDLRAGCSMADMANRKDIDRAWDYIKQATSELITPITYINCSADLKAFVGEHHGSICTSSNAEKVITWALNKGGKLLFFPDQHLGRNTCQKLGIKLDEMVVYNPTKLHGGLTPSQIAKAKVILWYGYCSVHQGFKTEHIERIRKTAPQMKIIVHPECPYEVVTASDLHGSTSFIIDTINNSSAGSEWAIGTEINLVSRLANAHPDKKIISLSPYQCLCTTMYRVRPRWLLESMRAIKRRNPINIIKVSPQITNFAMKALDRMLEIS